MKSSRNFLCRRKGGCFYLIESAGKMKNNRQFKLDDQIRICYQFSRELEHSDLNLNRFEELMSEKEIFSFENLLKIC